MVLADFRKDYQEYITRQDFAKLIMNAISRHDETTEERMLNQDGLAYPATSPFADTGES